MYREREREREIHIHIYSTSGAMASESGESSDLTLGSDYLAMEVLYESIV